MIRTKYFKTGKASIDRQLEAFIEFVVKFFNAEIVSVYLLGSYIDNSDIESSDLDVAVVYRDGSPREIGKITDFFSMFSRKLFKKEIDLYLISLDQIMRLDPEQLLTREGIVNIKIASRLLYGEDIRKKISLPNFDVYLRLTLKTPFYFMAKVRGGKLSLKKKWELRYPNGKNYYYGYLSCAADTHASVESKPVLSLIGWICTALVALKAKKMIGKKSDVAKAYAAHVADGWTSFVERAYTLIRVDLKYGLPKNKIEEKRLRELCSTLLDFENHFLYEYEKAHLKK